MCVEIFSLITELYITTFSTESAKTFVIITLAIADPVTTTSIFLIFHYIQKKVNI